MILLFALATLSVGEPVPEDMRGVWAKHGRCDLIAERLTLMADQAGYGADPSDPVFYDPEFKAVFWKREHVVDNFVRGARPDVLVHNTQGFHMPGEEGMARCGPDLVRQPWPPTGGVRP